MAKKKFNLENDLFGNKKYEKKFTLELDHETSIRYAKKIDKKKTLKLLEELVNVMEYVHKKGYEFPVTDLHISNYLKYLTAKYFTELEEAVNTTDYYKNMEVFSKTNDEGIITKILSVLPLDEIERVENEFENIIIGLNKLNDMDEYEREKVVKEVMKMKNITGLKDVGEKVVTHIGEEAIS